jgi:beta-glucosidase/6-phospho-beta-glucosidase/beta-galactosidase
MSPGWRSKDTVKAFGDYAGYVAEQLGDRVKHSFTINEFSSFVEGGYQVIEVQVGGGKTVQLSGAPGVDLSPAELKQVRHHAVLGHGLAVQAIRAHGPAGTKVGFAENMGVAVPVIDAPDYVKAAQAATRDLNAGFITVMLEGTYTEAYLAEAGGSTPRFDDDEMKVIASPLDFVASTCTSSLLRGTGRGTAGVPGDPDQRLPPQDAVGLAPARPGGPVLGAQTGARHLGSKIDLHHRERLRGIGRRR